MEKIEKMENLKIVDDEILKTMKICLKNIRSSNLPTDKKQELAFSIIESFHEAISEEYYIDYWS